MAGVAKPLTRWTQDTKIAFLFALERQGTVVKAARAIGRQPGTCYGVRARDPIFAAAWDDVVARVQTTFREEAGRGCFADPDNPRVGRERRDGWDEGKRRRFLAMLARGASVAEGCAAVGLSTTAAYHQRRRSARFAAEWDRALAEQGMSAIEAAHARAIDGWEEPVVFQGKVVATKRRYSDAALRLLIQREDKRREAAEAQAAAARTREGNRFAKPEETDKAILAKLAQIEARRAKIAREAALDFAERMTREGWAP